MDEQEHEPAVIRGRRRRLLTSQEDDRFSSPQGDESKGMETGIGKYIGSAELVPVDSRFHLGYISTTALILNKVIGSGIFLCPAIVLTATNSKVISLLLWVVGCLMTFSGVFVYLEYGLKWPYTGGELYYIDKVWTKPVKLFTYLFASVFVIVNGVYNNSLVFAREVILAGSKGSGPIDPNLQKFFAIAIVTFICQLQAFSRVLDINLSNALAFFKVTLLCFISICGMVALNGRRQQGSSTIPTPYGIHNLNDDLAAWTGDPYLYSFAMLNIMRAFLGYENANFVLGEIQTGPSTDERRVFRKSVILAVSIVCLLYVLVNVAFFAACTTEEIINQPETLVIFFAKIFGPSEGAQLASSVIVCMSSVGAIMALTYANVRVKQEIARLGILPFSEFWAKTSLRRTPARAILLHWIFTVLIIIICPLNMANGFLVISTFYSYIHTYFSIMLGGALLCAPWLRNFDPNEGQSRFKPQSTGFFGWWLLRPFAVIYVFTNASVLVLSWLPVNENVVLDTTAPTLPFYTSPVAAIAILILGAFLWCWDTHILHRLGYKFVRKEEKRVSDLWGIETIHVTYHREVGGVAARVCKTLHPAFEWCYKKIMQDSPAGETSGHVN